MALLPSALQTPIKELIAFKATVAESHPIDIDPAIVSYISETMASLQHDVQSINECRFEAEQLDRFFMTALQHRDPV